MTFCRISSLILFTVVLFGVTGCGDADPDPTDTDGIANALAEISDARSNPEKLNALFVPGSEPGEEWVQQSMKYTTVVTGAEVNGDSATVDVELEENLSGRVMGTVQWQCERVNDEWKIKTAPLQ